jgi:hypothetical protein
MRNSRNVLDVLYLNIECRQGANGCFTAQAYAFYVYIGLAEAVLLLGGLTGLLDGDLSGIGGAFFGTAEAAGAGT